jgi:2-iminobutanoate/2-iminopropanoate deaminase
MNSQEQAIGFTAVEFSAVGFTPGAPFSNGYVAGDTLYIAGQQGHDSDGRVTGVDIAKQTANAIAVVKHVAEEAGFKVSDIISVTTYLTDLSDVPSVNAVYTSLMPDPKPARAAVQVAGLIGGAKIEISAVAVRH